VRRIYLSPPHLGEEEARLVSDALASNWLAPLGPHVDAFEAEFSDVVGTSHALALSSGTAALHLALLVAGVGPGDEVVVPTLTFVATANAVRYVGSEPVFIDSHPDTWTIDPALLEDELATRAEQGRQVKAVLSVDLYGQCADYRRLRRSCDRFGVPIIEDAAEALGATYHDRPAGTLGDLAAFSFNGNKIITTSGGGMLVSDDEERIARARHLSTQARQPAPHFEHREVGYSYGMSNVLAALGRGQLRTLTERVTRRRAINAEYRAALEGLPGVCFMPEARYGTSTSWLTCLMIDPDGFGTAREDVIDHLAGRGIEARPTMKPMHSQQLYTGSPARGGAVATRIFRQGLCLPSGSSLSSGDMERVIDAVLDVAPAMTSRPLYAAGTVDAHLASMMTSPPLRARPSAWADPDVGASPR
jgi:dTDP-4-amino-4,6-dideoxygalactose transaminase